MEIQSDLKKKKNSATNFQKYQDYLKHRFIATAVNDKCSSLSCNMLQVLANHNTGSDFIINIHTTGNTCSKSWGATILENGKQIN